MNDANKRWEQRNEKTFSGGGTYIRQKNNNNNNNNNKNWQFTVNYTSHELKKKKKNDNEFLILD